MAQMSLSAWNVFREFNDLYKSGKLKEQKFTQADVTRGSLAVKQWHMKPLVSLPDETKEFLLNKVSSDCYHGTLGVKFPTVTKIDNTVLFIDCRVSATAFFLGQNGLTYHCLA